MKPSTLTFLVLLFAASAVLAIAMSAASSNQKVEDDEAVQALQRAADPDNNGYLQRSLGH